MKEIEVLLALGSVTRDLMAQLPKLKLIQTLSDGYEAVDIGAATELCIPVSYAPADLTGNSDSVAEYVILLMLATARNLSIALASLRDSSITKPGRSRTLLGSRVCIVGMGSIGAKVAERLLTFGVRITAVDRSLSKVPKQIPTFHISRLQEAVAEADFVVICVRATADNVHLFGADVIAAMKPGSILINVARGSMVDEQALYEAIRSGHLGGAGLDVEEHEPATKDDPLLSLPQVFLTPHEAGLTELNIRGTAEHIVEVLDRLQAGERIPSQVNQPFPRGTKQTQLAPMERRYRLYPLGAPAIDENDRR